MKWWRSQSMLRCNSLDPASFKQTAIPLWAQKVSIWRIRASTTSKSRLRTLMVHSISFDGLLKDKNSSLLLIVVGMKVSHLMSSRWLIYSVIDSHKTFSCLVMIARVVLWGMKSKWWGNEKRAEAITYIFGSETFASIFLMLLQFIPASLRSLNALRRSFFWAKFAPAILKFPSPDAFFFRNRLTSLCMSFTSMFIQRWGFDPSEILVESADPGGVVEGSDVKSLELLGDSLR